MIHIRPITPEDRADFLEMCREFYHSPAVLHAIPERNADRTFDALMAHTPYADAFILEMDEQVAGYVLTARTWSNEVGGETVWIEELYVRPDYQGKGAGHEMLAFLDQHYGPKIRRYRLEVTAQNAGAIRLYQQQGYEFFDYRQMVRDLPEK